MPRIVLTEAQVSALVQEPRVLELDLSDKPALRDLLRRLERHTTARNVDDPARYPTPPAEGNQADPSEKHASPSSQTRGGRRDRGRKATDDSSSAWRCAPQDPCGQLPNDDLGAIPLPPPLPTQSAFAPDTAGATILKHFESRHPHPHPSSSRAQTDVGVEQLAGEHRDRAHASGPGDVEISINTEA